MQKQVIRHHFPCIDSTNVWAKNHLKDLASDQIFYITADEQTAGRGQHGRRWISPPGVNFYGSFAFYYQSVPLAQFAAVLVSQVLEDLNFRPQIKWPNDILINGKKICGVLCETSDGKAIMGIGLNINMTEQMLKEIDQPATSLLVESGHSFDLEDIREQILHQFLEMLESDSIMDDYNRRR